MKIRTGFVTNSSSSSFICCFARIADEEKAKKVLEEYAYSIDVYTAEEVLNEINRTSWRSWLDCDWAGVYMTPSKDYIQEHMDSRFVVCEHCEDIETDEDGYADYDIDYEDCSTSAIDAITEENGFVDIECQWGAGFNG